MGWIASTMLAYGSWEPSVTVYEVIEPAGYEGEWLTLILRNQPLRREDRAVYATKEEALQGALVWPQVQHAD